MQGVSKGTGGLFAVDVLAPELIPSGSVYELLAEHRETLFAPAMWEDLFREGGRASIPGPVMGAAMVLQALEGVSDRGAIERLRYDLRWKHAAGLGIEEEPFHYSVFCYWRKRIAGSDRPNRVFDAVAGVIAQTGVLKGLGKRVMDSTVLFDAVARQSTIQMLIWQIAKTRRAFPPLVGFIDSLPGRAYYQERTRPEIDWSDPEAKNDLVSMLVNDAYAIIDRAEPLIASLGEDEAGAAQDVIGLLGLLAGQDVEPAEGSDGTDGRWRIAHQVGKDRVISTVDPQARHARKSRAARADGYKGHIVAEPETGLITGAAVTMATGPQSSDAAAGQDLLKADPAVAAGEVATVLGDSAYDTTTMLTTLAGQQIAAVIKPRPLPTAVPGGYSIDDFTPNMTPAQDQVRMTSITCPGGFTKPATAAGTADFRDRCGRCIIKDKCTTATVGRVVNLGPDRRARRDHRAKATSSEFTDTYRQVRPMAERAIAWMTRRLRRLPYRGAPKNNAAWQIRAAAINLQRLTNMGLRRAAGTWTTTPATL